MQRTDTDSGTLLPIDYTIDASHSIDASILDAIRTLQTDEDPNIVKELVTIYLEDSKSRLFEIRRAVRLRDSSLIQRAAHGLRGSSANLGARSLAALCASMETYPENPAVSDLLLQIETEFKNVTAALEFEQHR